MSWLIFFAHAAAAGGATASPEGVFATASVGTAQASGTSVEVPTLVIAHGIGQPRRRERPFPQSVEVRVVGVSARARVGRVQAHGQQFVRVPVALPALMASVPALTETSVDQTVAVAGVAATALVSAVIARADTTAQPRLQAVRASVMPHVKAHGGTGGTARVAGVRSAGSLGLVRAQATRRWSAVITEDDDVLLLGLVA